MKQKITLFLFLTNAYLSIGANYTLPETSDTKGNWYTYWGWNRGAFTKSDITFSGADYNFELKNVIGKERQSPFDFSTYFSPNKFTIPQYNFRLGYFLSNNWNVSFGIDHMKYVVKTNQTVKINGEIEDTSAGFNGTYNNADIVLSPDFLAFEHTDGLNYMNIELRRFDKLFVSNRIELAVTEGFGIGALVPRTNTTLMGKERYDEFHLSGMGVNAIVGLNILFFKHFFIQPELKGGYINMPNIRTTYDKADKAKQAFWFGQYNVVFGVTYGLFKKDKNEA